jgi:hypothetical protein
MEAGSPDACPLCQTTLGQVPLASGTDAWLIQCRNCGHHRFSGTVTRMLGRERLDPIERAVLAHQINRLAHETTVTSEMVTRWRADPRLPDAMERIDLLVLYFASTHRPGERLSVPLADLRARLGCEDSAATHWVFAQAAGMGYVGHEATSDRHTLTARGWQRYRELMREGAGSTVAFMAMKFGDAELDTLFAQHLVPAVAATGFELRTVAGDHKTAGSIDNRMRVEIRTSRFMLCDLTHGNRGAYWEAGFAEGLGRPVIYLCRRDVLHDRAHVDHPHFDTAHQLITPWSPSTVEDDMAELKAVIRNTLPTEAKMQDA